VISLLDDLDVGADKLCNYAISHGSTSPDGLWIRRLETDGRRAFIQMIEGVLTLPQAFDRRESSMSIDSDAMTENIVGSTMWACRDSAQIVPLSGIGSCVDVTERRRAEEAARER
jgi:hypothetical protein